MLAKSPATETSELALPEIDPTVDDFVDPIFAAIAENIRCYSAWDAALTRRSRIEGKLGKDSAEVDAAEAFAHHQGKQAEEALACLIATVPTSREGFFALLEHLPTRACYGAAGGAGPEEEDFSTICQTLSASLREIGRRSAR
ncbi:hypothetical protein [Xanthobacter aminoxidans]|uniref:Uncharacterized protein n=1 Tax=Xanthobacter aminoxidans TaxID=186280 RepID=A0ABW6ZBJ9_9HYPH